MASITLKNVYKRYDGNENYSVTDFNLEINPSLGRSTRNLSGQKNF